MQAGIGEALHQRMIAEMPLNGRSQGAGAAPVNQVHLFAALHQGAVDFDVDRLGGRFGDALETRRASLHCRSVEMRYSWFRLPTRTGRKQTSIAALL